MKKKLGILSGLMLAATLSLSAQSTNTSEVKETKGEQKTCTKTSGATSGKSCCAKKASCSKSPAVKEEEIKGAATEEKK